MNFSLADLRQNYTCGGLKETDADPNPLKLFQLWLEQAISAQLLEPNAMTLATTTVDGYPFARMVLLKALDELGFVFYTNYHSDKGQQLTLNPKAALVFWWAEFERQVRVEGIVEKIDPQQSDEYFHSRPRGSQLGAWASNQSDIIENREILEKRLEELEQKYRHQKIPRPPHWGGFRLYPKVIEFWQGRPKRLHDRLRYRLLDNNQWHRERLSP